MFSPRRPPRATVATRGLRLFLAAVLLPSAAVVILGVRSTMRDRELDRRRQEDERRAAIDDFRQRVLGRLEHIRFQELAAAADARYPDTSIAFAATVDNGRLELPWQFDSATAAFARDRGLPAFAAVLAREQQMVAREPGSDSARAAVQRARAAATDPSQRDYVDLIAARGLAKPGRLALLRSLAARPLTERDEYGVPFAFYAAAALTDAVGADESSVGVVDTLVHRAVSELLVARSFSPIACFQLRAIAAGRSSARVVTAVANRCADLSAAERLADYVPGLIEANARSGRSGTSTWTYWGDAGWFLGFSNRGAGQRLLAVRAADVAQAGRDSLWRVVAARATRAAEPLGDDLLYAAVVPPPAPPASAGTSRSPLLATTLLLVALLAGGSAALLWRDVRREAAVGALRADFVSAVSHELKTPLTTIRMYVETLRDRPELPADRREQYLATVLTESERLSRLLDNVLDLTRIEHGERRYLLSPMSLSSLAETAAQVIRPAMLQDGFDFQTDIAADVWVRGDEDALMQALLNLLANAMKYSPFDRRVALCVSVHGSEARLAVQDAGVGIASADVGRIFEKFYRAPSGRETGAAGAGLGLTLAQHIVVGHGGAITVASQPGRGSTFTAVLPLVAAPRAPGAAHRESAAEGALA